MLQRERAPFARTLGVVAGQAQYLESFGGSHCPEASGTCHTSRHLCRTASRGVLSHRHVPPNRSRRTASCRGRSPPPLVQRAGGLRCSRLHSGVCSHSPRLLPVRSRLPHKSQFTRISYLASASPSPRTCWAVRPSQASMEKLVSDMGRRGFDRMRSPRAATMIALASATGHAHVAGQPNRRGRDDALLDALPDAVGLARLCGSVAPGSRCNIARLGGVSRTG